jgi:hypothetical protein
MLRRHQTLDDEGPSDSGELLGQAFGLAIDASFLRNQMVEHEGRRSVPA